MSDGQPVSFRSCQAYPSCRGAFWRETVRLTLCVLLYCAIELDVIRHGSVLALMCCSKHIAAQAIRLKGPVLCRSWRKHLATQAPVGLLCRDKQLLKFRR